MENESRSGTGPPYSPPAKSLKAAINNLKKFMKNDYGYSNMSACRKTETAEILKKDLGEIDLTSFEDFNLQSFAKFVIEEQRKKLT